MPSFYTRAGDDGYTGLLGEGRVPKYDMRPEAIGCVDEAMAALGMARATCKSAEAREIILGVQRDLYALMAETAATPENAEKFHAIDSSKVSWLETQTDELARLVEMPHEFIIPGDTLAGAMLDLARTITRRAERRLAELLHRGDIRNPELMRYLNRLSSLCFVLEIREIQIEKNNLTLAKVRSDDRDNH
jgi:cob(I)alamin adenosyltransferase